MKPDVTAVISGASRGFGRALALALARRFQCMVKEEALSDHAHRLGLVLMARCAEGLEETEHLARSIYPGADFFLIVADAGDQASWRQGVEGAVRWSREYVGTSYHEHDSLLFNNHGLIEPLGKVSNLLDYESVRRHVEVNLSSACWLTSQFCAEWCSPKAHSKGNRAVVNISSLAAVQETPSWGLYSSTKAAREMFHQTASAEFPEIFFLNYAPGPMDTDMQAVVRGSEDCDSSVREMYSGMYNQHKLVEVADSADLCVRLAISDEGVRSGLRRADYYDYAS